MIRRSLILTLLVAGCAPAPAVVTPSASVAATTPLQAVASYRLSAAGTPVPDGFSVLGVSPPVSGKNLFGTSFMVRPATHEVMRVGADGAVAVWGGIGATAGRFNAPESIAVSLQKVYVADTGNHRIQAFNFDGTPSGQWGSFGVRPGQFVHPRSVEVLFDGQVVVTDDFRVQYFDADGAFVVDVPIAMAARPQDATGEATKAREAALSSMRAVLASVADDVQALQGDGRKLADYVRRLQDAAVEASPLTQTAGAPFAQAVVSASLRMLVAQALPTRQLAAVTAPTGMIQNVGGVSQAGSGVRATGVSAMDIQGMDLETAMMMVQTQRANLLEAQLKAQIQEVQSRNETINKLNNFLGELNRIAATLKSDATATTPVFTDANRGTYTDAELARVADVAKAAGVTTAKRLADFKKSDLDAEIQRIKSLIDSQGNSQQMDMLRLQSMSNKRNEAFDVMTNFVKKMQESRSSIIGNMR